MAMALVVLMAVLPSTSWADDVEDDDREGIILNEKTLTRNTGTGWVCLGIPYALPNYFADDLFYLMDSTCSEVMESQRHSFIVQEYDVELETWANVDYTINPCNNCQDFRSPASESYVFPAAPGAEVRVFFFYYACSYTGSCDSSGLFLGPFQF